MRCIKCGQTWPMKAFVYSLLIGVIYQSTASAQSEFTTAEIEFVEQWLPIALDSNSLDDLVVGALVAEAHVLPIDSSAFYARAMELNSSSNDYLHGLVAHCSDAGLVPGCDELDNLARLKAENPGNALAAAYIALYHIESGNIEEALAELKSSLKNKLFDDRTISRSQLVHNKLSQIGYPRERLRFMSTRYSLDNMPADLYQAIINTCNEHGANSQDWKETCIGFGRVMEDYGDTYVAVRVGQAIQGYMLSFSDSDVIEMESVDRRRAYTHRWRELAAERLDFIRMPIDGPDIFYDDWLNYNELYAMNQALGRLDGMRVR